MNQNEKIMLTLQESADFSGLSYNAIRNLCISKKLAHVTVGKSKRYINQAVLKEFLLGTTDQAPTSNVVYGAIRRQGV